MRMLGFALLLAATCSTSTQAREVLDRSSMLKGTHRGSVDFSAYAPSSDAQAPTHRFEGRLILGGQPEQRTLVANTDYLSAQDIAKSKSFPEDFDYAFVQHGDALIPQKRGPIRGTHPWWEVILEPGRVWNEPGDAGLSRAAIPFALTQKNANCTHNGVLMFLFDDKEIIGRAAVQISSETCLYLQRDVWGWLQARYVPEPLPDAAQRVAEYQAELASRIPTRPLSVLGKDFPGLDAAKLATAPDRSRTRHGVYFKGIHYVADCPTRHGNYPYCDVLDVPSYSVAKSVVGGVALMRMQKRFPGSAGTSVGIVPASGCRREDWKGVSLLNLLDMASGHYDAATYMADEDAAKIVQFFNPVDYAHKLAFSCDAYPNRSEPGKTWVYHTADTFLLGVGLDAVLKKQTRNKNADIFSDVIDADIFGPLKLSPTARTTRRTYDAFAQPFVGWGLFLHGDDMVKLGRFLAENDGEINGQALLDSALLDQALQRDPDQRGMQVAHLEKFRYQHGFWARNLQKELGCDQPAWVPFMSGFGGILVVMFPNGAIWYSAADDGELASINFAEPARQLSRLGSMCKEE